MKQLRAAKINKVPLRSDDITEGESARAVQAGDALQFSRLHYKYESILIGGITEVDE